MQTQYGSNLHENDSPVIRRESRFRNMALETHNAIGSRFTPGID